MANIWLANFEHFLAEDHQTTAKSLVATNLFG
jgi:hypothetical protein